MTAPHTEHRARAPPGGTLSGSTWNAVRQSPQLICTNAYLDSA